MGRDYTTLMQAVNRTLTPSITTSRGTTNALKLAKITLRLTLTELNGVPGGLHMNPGESITASQLTEEQRTVLANHRGLIREALRQLKAAKAEENAPVSG